MVSPMASTLDTAVTSDEKLVQERVDQLLSENDPKTTQPKDFLGAQNDLGLAWVHFPEGYGGLGVGPKLQRIVQERVGEAGGAPPHIRHPNRLRMGAPA